MNNKKNPLPNKSKNFTSEKINSNYIYRKDFPKLLKKAETKQSKNGIKQNLYDFKQKKISVAPIKRKKIDIDLSKPKKQKLAFIVFPANKLKVSSTKSFNFFPKKMNTEKYEIKLEISFGLNYRREVKNKINDNITNIYGKQEIINNELIYNKKRLKNEILKENDYKPNLFIKDKYYNKKEGLYNFGTTCYFNSYIQILIHIPGLIKQLNIIKNNVEKNSLLNNLLNLADNPTKENLFKLKKEFIKRNQNYKYDKQEDSQKFGLEFLNILNEELIDSKSFIGQWKLEEEFDLKKKYQKSSINKLNKLNDLLNDEDCDFKEQTIIKKFFFYYENIMRLDSNKEKNFNFFGNSESQLSFNIKNINKDNLELKQMLEKKYLYGLNKFIKLPIIFNITLLRSLIDKPLIETKVIINEEVNLKDFLDSDFGTYLLPTIYKIYALNICKGHSKSWGHYYSYIIINNEWYKFDDLNVSKVEKSDIEEDLSYIYGVYYINKEYFDSFKDK